jgi:L-gulonolactone oxidase
MSPPHWFFTFMQNTHPPLTHFSVSELYALLQPITLSPGTAFRNWGHTFRCTPLTIFEPVSEYQCELILELARREGRTVRAVGVGHSPSDLACTSGFMVRMGRLNQVLEVRTELILFVCICGTSSSARTAGTYTGTVALILSGSFPKAAPNGAQPSDLLSLF